MTGAVGNVRTGTVGNTVACALVAARFGRRRIFTKINRFLLAVQPQLTIAGHAAQEVARVGIVIDLLSMLNRYGTEARYLVLRLRNFRSPDQRRAWAEKVARRC